MIPVEGQDLSLQRSGILFDLDETVLDRSKSLRNFASWQALNMLSLSGWVASDFVERFIELDDNGSVWKDVVYATLIEEFDLHDWSMQDLLNSYLLCFCAFCKPRPGIAESIRKLHDRGFKLGIITNGKSPFQERNFRALGLSDYFDVVVVSEAVDLRKPDKDIFELACYKLGVDVGLSTMVGDSISADIEGARQAGMRTLYVPVDIGKDSCDIADNTCHDLEQLHALFPLSEKGR